MNIYYLLVFIVILSSTLQLTRSLFIESIIIGSGAAWLGYTFRCNLYECCEEAFIQAGPAVLKQKLRARLYGQHIANHIISSAIESHFYHENPRKPLVLSLHGLPGSGKNYVVTMIAEALFKKGEKSKHYHFFNGRSDFPSDIKVDMYKEILRDKILQALDTCERSVFVFDEVDKMPRGLLDIIVPFIDYSSWNSRKKSKSIFIFLSNTGSNQIVKRMIDLWQNGKNREETTLQDFESLIAIGAFNEDGGLYKSGPIESKLIDHHIPFLPMEEKHVIRCIVDIFQHWGIFKPSQDLIQQALAHVTYGPPPHNLYSTAGCKRLDHKVSSIIHKREFLNNWEN